MRDPEKRIISVSLLGVTIAWVKQLQTFHALLMLDKQAIWGIYVL
jgi:hypothetical protein